MTSDSSDDCVLAVDDIEEDDAEDKGAFVVVDVGLVSFGFFVALDFCDRETDDVELLLFVLVLP